MSKVILFDADGVVIKKHPYFSEKYSLEYGVPIEEVAVFFKNEYKDVAIGKAELEDTLPKYLEKWNWKGTLDEFLLYWFKSEIDLDEKVLEKVKGLRIKGVKCYIASDNPKRRAEYLMKTVGLEDKFDGVFFSADLGFTKSQPEFFKKIIDELKVEPPEIEYWDDDPENVEVAKGLGINAHVYTAFDEFGISINE